MAKKPTNPVVLASPYYKARDVANLSRMKAAGLMSCVTESMIDKFERGVQTPTPYDILQMAEAYKSPELCNYYCTHICDIGIKYMPEVEITDLRGIVMKALNYMHKIDQNSFELLGIAEDGRITGNEIKAFAEYSIYLEEISKALHALDLWMDKAVLENNLNQNELETAKNRFRTELETGTIE